MISACAYTDMAHTEVIKYHLENTKGYKTKNRCLCECAEGFSVGVYLLFFLRPFSLQLICSLSFSLRPDMSVLVFKVHIPCSGSGLKGGEERSLFLFLSSSCLQSCCRWSDQLCAVCHPLIILLFLHVSILLNLYSLEIYPGIYSIQLAVQGMKGGSLGGLSGPAVHHNPVNVLGTAGWTGQPKPGGQQV